MPIITREMSTKCDVLHACGSIVLMVRQRVVLGAIGDAERARQAARRLRDAGQEVVYVGGDQTPEQLVRALIAEDAAAIVVDGDAESLARVADLCAELGAGDALVTPLDVASGAPRSP
jgi:methylmalonyl-CoA mutase C-terminal domain/subunit